MCVYVMYIVLVANPKACALLQPFTGLINLFCWTRPEAVSKFC